MEETEISPEVADYIKNLNAQLNKSEMDKLALTNNMTAGSISGFGSTKDPNLVEYQLDPKEILNSIFHLLSGHELEKTEKGERWVEPIDDRMKIFSAYGVKEIMRVLSFYINKNTLLGFYDTDTILWKVRDFGIELSDLFLNRYEVLLYYPTPEDLFEKYKPLVKQENLDIEDDELYEKCVRWSEEELEARENHLPIIGLAIIDMVHGAYMRAWHGKERQSLGERGININQQAGGQDQLFTPTNKPGMFGKMFGK